MKVLTTSDVEACHLNAVKKGFWDVDKNLAAKLALIHSEVSECLEALREDPSDLEQVGEELADICIRVFDLAGFLKIPLIEAIHKKMARNKERPYLHGKKF